MAKWARVQVEERLEEAAAVMKRLPPVRVQGYFSAWPEVVHSFGDRVGQEPRLKLPPLSARTINRMDETMLGLRWLEPELGKLVWARAEGTSWKPICWRFGIARATAHRRWEYGLSVIVAAERVPTKRSRRYVVEGVLNGGRSDDADDWVVIAAGRARCALAGRCAS